MDNASLPLGMLHAMESRETTLLSNAAFLAAIYVDLRYQVFLENSQKIVAQAHLAALCRRLQMLQESVDTTDVECLDSSSKSENRSTPACEVDIIDELLALLDACNASSSQSPRNEQNVTETINCFNNQVRLLRNINILEWWEKQAESDHKGVANLLLLYQLLKPALKELFRV